MPSIFSLHLPELPPGGGPGFVMLALLAWPGQQGSGYVDAFFNKLKDWSPLLEA